MHHRIRVAVLEPQEDLIAEVFRKFVGHRVTLAVLAMHELLQVEVEILEHKKQ